MYSVQLRRTSTGAIAAPGRRFYVVNDCLRGTRIVPLPLLDCACIHFNVAAVNVYASSRRSSGCISANSSPFSQKERRREIYAKVCPLKWPARIAPSKRKRSLVYLIVVHLMARNIGALCEILSGQSIQSRTIALNRNGTMDEEECTSVSRNRINRGV